MTLPRQTSGHMELEHITHARTTAVAYYEVSKDSSGISVCGQCAWSQFVALVVSIKYLEIKREKLVFCFYALMPKT